MQRLAIVVVSSVLLLSSVSAQALDFTTAAYETWTFSGIEVELEQGGPTPSRLTQVFNDSGGGSTDVMGFTSLPGTGFAGGSGGLTQASSSASLVGSGFANATVYNDVFVHSKEIGLSTITVNYRFEERGTVPLGTSLHATSSLFFDSGYKVTGEFAPLKVETIVTPGQSLDITRITTGTFTASAFFDTVGSTNGMEFTLRSTVNSVPVPATLWPSFVGLVLLAVWWERRKAREPFSLQG